MKLLHPHEAEKLHNQQEVEVANRIQSLSKYSTEVEKNFFAFKEKLDENAKALEVDFSSFAAETSTKRRALLDEIKVIEDRRDSLAEINWDKRHKDTEEREKTQDVREKDLQAVKNRLDEIASSLADRETNCSHRETAIADAEKSHSERVSRTMEREIRLGEERQAFDQQKMSIEAGLNIERQQIAKLFKDLAFQQEVHQRDLDQLRMEKAKFEDEKKHLISQQHDLRAAFLEMKSKGLTT